MDNKFIHIISLDVPFPADYGGAIDIFYRIQALHELGYKIILHCWEYGRGEQEKLKEITHEVHYYKRKKSPLFIFNKLPFIVISRQSNELFQRLLKDTYPILFEGIHTTLLLNNPRLKDRIKLVRSHNIEHDYYSALAKNTSGWKGWFYRKEAKKIEAFESNLKHANWILAIQKKDVEHYKKMHNNVCLLPASIPPLSIVPTNSLKNYCLFHGNLSVLENDLAAKWMIDNCLYEGLNFVIAGKNPSKELVALAEANHIELIANPSTLKMEDLTLHANVHLLVSDQATGIKLKLINSLSTGGHLLVNPTMVEGTDLGGLCTVFKDAEECKNSLKTLMEKPVSVAQLHERFEVLQAQFDTFENCKVFEKLI